MTIADKQCISHHLLNRHGLRLTQDQVDRLHDAMLLIGDVADEMDSSSVECEACGAKRRTHWHSHQINVKLMGVHDKLTRLLNAEWYHRKED
jgi:uncharacterized ferredoxin-like protein